MDTHLCSWAPTTGPCSNQDSSLQHWNANLWWDLTRPERLIQSSASLRQWGGHCCSNLRPESPGAAFPWYMHNKLEQRRCSENDGLWIRSYSTSSLLSLLPPKNPTSSLPVTVLTERRQGSVVRAQGKSWLRCIYHFTWGHILGHVHHYDIYFLYWSPDLDCSNIKVGVVWHMGDTTDTTLISRSKLFHWERNLSSTSHI